MALRYFTTGGTNIWSSTTIWSTTSGGVGGSAIPTASDDVIFDATSPSTCILDVSTAKFCKSLNCTGYTGTQTWNIGLTANGDVKFNSGMTINGTGSLTLNAGGNMDFRGLIFPNSIITNSSSQLGLISDFNYSGNLTGVGGVTWSGQTAGLNINCYGSWNPGQSHARGATNPPTLRLISTGGTKFFSNGGTLSLDTVFNSSGTYNVGGFSYALGTLTYTAGNVIVTGGTLTLGGSGSGGATFNTNPIKWQNISIGNSGTYTLQSDFTILGNFINSGNIPIFAGSVSGLSINLYGNLTQSQNVQAGTNAPTLYLLGNTTWTATNLFPLSLNTVINTTGATTINGSVIYTTGILTYSAGTISGATSNLTLGTGALFNVNNNLTLPNTLTYNDNCTIGGTSMLTVKNLSGSTAGKTLTLKSGNNYIVTSNLNLAGTSASNIGLSATTTGSRAILTLNQGALQDISFCTTKDIDSSQGQTVWDFKGTLNNTLNWNILTPNFISSASF